MRSTSVVVPCYNVDHYLGDALSSIAAQSTPVLEIILVDDGSRMPLVSPPNWSGPPLRIIRKPNGGLPAARNTGIAAATGEFVAFLDADDLWELEKVAMQEAALRNDPSAAACYTRCVDREGFYAFGPYPPMDVSDEDFLLVLWYGQFFPPSSVMVRRDALNAVGGFEEKLKIGEDLELWLRLLRRGRFLQIPEPLTGYRQHNQQLTNNLMFKIIANGEARKIIIDRDADLLTRAGVPPNRLWYAYRNELLLSYYRRQFSVARPLLWRYWMKHLLDAYVLKCALTSLLPASLIASVRGTLSRPDGKSPQGQTVRDWTRTIGQIRSGLASGIAS
jgi:glycosyltransferase involved in cell wall biosynthesis